MTSASTTAGPEQADYRSLYVADLGEITGGDPRGEPEDRDRVPDYYRDLACDDWFQIWDLRRVVANDTPGVIEALRPLRNTCYHDRPVSLYGGMVDLPLIVWRDPERRDRAERAALSAAAKGVGIAFRPRAPGTRRRPLAGPGRPRAAPEPRHDQGIAPPRAPVAEGIRTVAPNELPYLTDEYKLPRQLEKIMGMRNPAAHTGSVERSELLARREEILGIGQMGVLGEMMRVRMRVGGRRYERRWWGSLILSYPPPARSGYRRSD
jgi:hypothetical protein